MLDYRFSRKYILVPLWRNVHSFPYGETSDFWVSLCIWALLNFEAPQKNISAIFAFSFHISPSSDELQRERQINPKSIEGKVYPNDSSVESIYYGLTGIILHRFCVFPNNAASKHETNRRASQHCTLPVFILYFLY